MFSPSFRCGCTFDLWDLTSRVTSAVFLFLGHFNLIFLVFLHTLILFSKNGAYFQTTKINFVAQIWTRFDLLLNHNHQQNYGLHFQTVLAELTTSWLQTSVFMECLLSLSWQKLSSLNPLRCFWLWASLKTCSPATPRKKSTPLSILGLIVIRSD